jgi:NAD(P)-dependent dehydrogenase (short-subunit alcohol dehydrogenase family)
VSLLLTTPRTWVERHVRSRLPGAESRNPLQDRRILVTGASSGIGEATAVACAARGATVLLVARRADELERVRAAVVASGGTAYAYPCDLTDGDSVDDLVRTVMSDHGGVDMLVNNAGRSIRRSIALSYDRMHDFERTMAINYFAPVRLMLGLLPAMVEQRFGHVVNIQTWGVQVKAPKFSAYIASKTALDTWSRIAGRELYGDGVTFTNVRMSLVRTDMIGPTDAYRRAPAMTPEQAAARVVRAIEDRPLTVNVLAGSAAEVLNLVAPRLSDALFHRLDRRFPDSPAARAHAEESELQAPRRRVAD